MKVGRVRHQDGVEQRLVARLQVRQHEIFLQIVIEIGDLGVPARHLQLDRGHGGRQQTFETLGRRSASVKAVPLLSRGLRSSS